MIVRYNSELTNGRDISEIKKELLLHDDYVQKKVIEGLDSGLIKKSQALNNANEKGKKVILSSRESIKDVIDSDLNSKELDNYDTILSRHKNIFGKEDKDD